MNKETLKDMFLPGLLFGIFIYIFYPVWQNLITVWGNSDDYSHGFFIVPISLYIIWTKKNVMKETPLKPSWYGFFLMIFSLVFYILSQYGSIITLAPISMLLFIIGIIIFLFGFGMLKVIGFPLFFLFLMIPVPGQIYSAVTIPLQLFVTKTTVEMARLLSIPILREGNVIHLANTTLQVVNACSGLRSMISLFALCTIFGYFTLQTNIFKIILCASSIFAAIIVNIFRVLIMVLAHHYYSYDLAHGEIHTVFGIVVFTLALAIVYLTQLFLSFGEKRFDFNKQK
ncbi:MAG: exosortase/archaeosortase family protein [Desulfobacula sp.]|nr:exosortase/archaeosortase family protein [Desulfobacula sp.]